MVSKIFRPAMPAAILIGSSISLQDTDKPFQWMEFGKFQDVLARASSVVKDHVMNSFFKDYLLSSAFVSDIGNRGMLLQRLKETKPSWTVCLQILMGLSAILKAWPKACEGSKTWLWIHCMSPLGCTLFQ